MTIPMLRRYSNATVGQEDGRFIVMLDAKPLQTPAQRALQLPSRALALAIADEWAGQQVKLDFTRLPLTQLAMTAHDLPVDCAALLEFLETELVIHYADDTVLATAQDRLWQPLREWLVQRFGAILPRATGILPSREPIEPGSIKAYLADGDAFTLTALSEASSALGSLVIALALIEGRIDVGGAVAAAEIDSDYQMLRWVEDPDILKRRAALQTELSDIARFLTLARS